MKRTDIVALALILVVGLVISAYWQGYQAAGKDIPVIGDFGAKVFRSWDALCIPILLVITWFGFRRFTKEEPEGLLENLIQFQAGIIWIAGIIALIYAFLFGCVAEGIIFCLLAIPVSIVLWAVGGAIQLILKLKVAISCPRCRHI